MPISFRCKKCKAQIQARKRMAGKKTKCPECEAIFRIPNLPGTAQKTPRKEELAEVPSSDSDEYLVAAATVPEVDDFWSQSTGPHNSPASRAAFATDPSFPTADQVLTVAEARKRLRLPAMVIKWLAILSIILWGSIIVFLLWALFSGNGDYREIRGIFQMIFFIYFSKRVVSGMNDARRLENHGEVKTSFFLSMIPCMTGPFFIIAIPFAAWGIGVISHAEVERHFRD
ncbi:MAG: hypothetical protein COA78_12320 [Blastopirellula sp.]|nr:MAG: hypothetical protein COA78_12320 [Blastopirellula sp.]